MLLQITDLMANRAGRYIQFFGCLGEIVVAGGHFQGSQSRNGRQGVSHKVEPL